MTASPEMVESFTDWLVDPDTIVLVACSAEKADTAAPARDLYRGQLFRRAVEWAESWDLRWFVLSAEHGIVDPDAIVEPYDTTGAAALAQVDVAAQLAARDLDLSWGVVVVGGQTYSKVVTAALPDVSVWCPLQELPDRGLGHFKHWLINATEAATT